MFFDTFKRLCDERHISVSAAATVIGLSNSTPTKWKKTGATPDGDTLTKIATYFGVTTDYLLGFTLDAQIDETVRKIRDLETELKTASEEDRFNLEMALDITKESYDDLILARDLSSKEKAPAANGERNSEMTPAFFRLKKGLEPYDLSEDDADFLLEVYKAHVRKNRQE